MTNLLVFWHDFLRELWLLDYFNDCHSVNVCLISDYSVNTALIKVGKVPPAYILNMSVNQNSFEFVLQLEFLISILKIFQKQKSRKTQISQIRS